MVKIISKRVYLQRCLAHSVDRRSKKLIVNSIAVFSILNEFAKDNVCRLTNQQLATLTGITLPNVWAAKKFLSGTRAISETKVRKNGKFTGELITGIRG